MLQDLIDQSDDVEEIIDTTETINLDDPSLNEDEPSNVTLDEERSTVETELPDSLSIKQEKPDVSAASEKQKDTNDSESTSISIEDQEGKTDLNFCGVKGFMKGS